MAKKSYRQLFSTYSFDHKLVQLYSYENFGPRNLIYSIRSIYRDTHILQLFISDIAYTRVSPSDGTPKIAENQVS